MLKVQTQVLTWTCHITKLMRTRSNAFHCEDLESFVNNTVADKRRMIPEAPTLNSNIEYLENFEYDTTEEYQFPQASRGRGIMHDERRLNSVDGSGSVFKALVIGNPATGKHHLLHMLFDVPISSPRHGNKHSHDFVQHSREICNITQKYLFWVIDLNDHKYEMINSTYYKILDTIVLTFDLSKQSEMIDLVRPVQMIQNTRTKTKKTIILIGNQTSSSSSSKDGVSQEMIRQFCLEFNIEHYFEINHKDRSNANEILDLISKNNNRQQWSSLNWWFFIRLLTLYLIDISCYQIISFLLSPSLLPCQSFIFTSINNIIIKSYI